MRLDRAFVVCGAFFVGLGAVPLAARAGWISHAALADAWRLWPVMLIVIGVAVLVRRSPIAVLGAAIVGLTVGGTVGTAATLGSGRLVGCGGTGVTGAAALQRSGSFVGGAADADVGFACGTLQVNTRPGASWTALGWGPAADASVSATADSLRIRPAGGIDLGVGSVGGNGRLAVTLPTTPALDLRLSESAGALDARLAGAHLSGLQADLNAADSSIDLTGAVLNGPIRIDTTFGSTRLTLPADASASGTIQASFGDLEVCVPQGVGVRLTATSSFGSQDISGLGPAPETSVWQSADYLTAASHVDLQVGSSFGSFHFNHGGC